jgi:hypothetical protein
MYYQHCLRDGYGDADCFSNWRKGEICALINPEANLVEVKLGLQKLKGNKKHSIICALPPHSMDYPFHQTKVW